MNEVLASRPHSFDGFFYPKKSNEIVSLVQNFFKRLISSKYDIELLKIVSDYIKNKRILTFIVPHGSYRFSGFVSSFVYYLIESVRCTKFILLSSDHNGTSPGISIMRSGFWTTPLGKIQVDEKMALNLLKNDVDNLINIDPFSFLIDHTIEVQLPFLQHVKKSNDIYFLPVLTRCQDKASSIKLANMLHSIVPKDETVILLSTSNFLHYLPRAECYRGDGKLLSDIISLNIDSFYENLKYYPHLICGYGCIASAMEFSKLSGNNDAVLLKYQTSGDVDGNESSVVGYSSIVMF